MLFQLWPPISLRNPAPHFTFFCLTTSLFGQSCNHSLGLSWNILFLLVFVCVVFFGVILQWGPSLFFLPLLPEYYVLSFVTHLPTNYFMFNRFNTRFCVASIKRLWAMRVLCKGLSQSSAQALGHSEQSINMCGINESMHLKLTLNATTFSSSRMWIM